MTIQVTHWDEVTQADFDLAFAQQVQIVNEKHPELDTRRGAIHDISLTLQAVLAAALRISQQRFMDSSSLLAISENPELADPDTVARLFSRFLVTPRPGAQATGLITVVVSQPTPLVLPAGTVFTAESQSYTTDYSVAARANVSDILSPTDKLLEPQVDGTYAFTFNVTAVVPGSAGIIRQKTVTTPEKPIANFVTAYAAQDFTGGQDADTTTTMLSRLQGGIAAKTWSNSANLAALVKSHPLFTSAQVSVVGAGDPEMLRDKHSVFPVAFGNRVDVWVRQPGGAPTATIVKAATYTGPGVNGPLWRIPLTRDELPGAYVILSVLRSGRANSATVVPTQFVREYAPSNSDPDITSALEAGYSRYQSGYLVFTDAFEAGETLAVGATVNYAVTGSLTPDLPALQTFLDSAELRPVAGDVVVRGAVPCFLSVDLRFDTAISDTVRANIQTAVAKSVNSLGFSGTVYASSIAALVLPLIPAGVNLRRIRLTGVLFRPDGTYTVSRDRELLQIPDEPGRMVSSKTAAFYLDPSSVAVNQE